MSPARVVVWREPVSKERALRDLLTAISAESPAIDVEEALRRIEERERKGSTFFNEGVALPHARFEGLPAPEVALGIAREGILDAGTERPIEAVFLLLAPGEGEGVRMLAEAARALQSPEVRRRLRESPSTREAAALLAAPPA